MSTIPVLMGLRWRQPPTHHIDPAELWTYCFSSDLEKS